MDSTTVSTIKVPDYMKNLLKDINRALLKEQTSLADPEKVLDRQEILDFLANYLNTLVKLRDTTGEVISKSFKLIFP